MDKKKIYFLILVSFFPVFSLRSNLNLIEIFYSFSIFFIPILLINYYFTKISLNSNFFKIYLSLIFVFGIDNNFGLWNGFVVPNTFDFIDIFGVIYIPAFLIIVSLTILFFFILKYADSKFINVILIFLFTIFIFNVFDGTKSYKNIIDFEKVNKQKYENTKVVIIFDEMSGLNSLESSQYNGEEFNILARNFFKKHEFEFYSDVNTANTDTISSIAALLNFTMDSSIRDEVIVASNNYFTEYNLTKSSLFNEYSSISIYQNIHINFCNFNNIVKCESYNIFKEDNFIPGFKDNFFSKIISLWKINGSIYSTLTWRSLRQLRIIDSILEPIGHKATFPNLFKKIEDDIYTKKYDLIFVHTLVPHVPYAFDEKCNFDGKKSLLNRYKSLEGKIRQHNLERKCVLFYLDIFLENLKKNNVVDSIDFTILSDHGGRTLRGENTSYFPVIYANKNSTKKFKEISQKSISQQLFMNQLK